MLYLQQAFFKLFFYIAFKNDFFKTKLKKGCLLNVPRGTMLDLLV